MNPQTLIIAAIVFGLTAFIIAREVIKKKKGESACGCGCGGCAFKDSCHGNQKKL